MTTFEDTVVGVLAAITTPINNKEFTGICNLKNKKTKPNNKKWNQHKVGDLNQ